jgi:hypothetical protein
LARRRHLQCPFCDNYLAAPVEINIKNLEITGGICTCGAVYALDRTGHNLGEIYMDALTFACKGDIDKSLSLDPEDYATVDYDYDINSNTTGKGGSSGRLCKLLFVKIND